MTNKHDYDCKTHADYRDFQLKKKVRKNFYDQRKKKLFVNQLKSQVKINKNMYNKNISDWSFEENIMV